jgi:hypothetical protein
VACAAVVDDAREQQQSGSERAHGVEVRWRTKSGASTFSLTLAPCNEDKGGWSRGVAPCQHNGSGVWRGWATGAAQS